MAIEEFGLPNSDYRYWRSPKNRSNFRDYFSVFLSDSDEDTGPAFVQADSGTNNTGNRAQTVIVFPQDFLDRVFILSHNEHPLRASDYD